MIMLFVWSIENWFVNTNEVVSLNSLHIHREIRVHSSNFRIQYLDAEQATLEWNGANRPTASIYLDPNIFDTHWRIAVSAAGCP